VGKSKFKVGDLVKCVYGFPDLYYGVMYSEDFLPAPETYGIVVSVYWDQIIFQNEWVYEIKCLDGNYRYFLQSEMVLADNIL
tara:strand:+ start:3685 stop:3930 length:246 start_codon:yes stop_codon:yes gene_type:complete